VTARSRVPKRLSSLSLILAVPFVLAGCGGDAESAPDLEGEFVDATAEEVQDAAAAPPAAAPPPAQAPPASQPAAPPSSQPAPPPAGAPEAEAEASETLAPEELVEESAVEPLAIPAGTRIPAVMQSALSTRTHQAGDVFFARVGEEVLAADGMVLVPEGARLEGRVVESRQSAGSDDEALLLLTFEAVLIDGERFPMNASVAEAEMQAQAQASGARSAATVATGAAAGAVVGRILGGDTRSTVGGAAVGAVAGAGVALTTRDGHAEIAQGSRITVELQAPALLVGR